MSSPIEKRAKPRTETGNIRVGLSKSYSIFIKTPSSNPFQVLDISEIGFQALCTLHAMKGDHYDFSFELPLYGEIAGRVSVQWRKKIDGYPHLARMGFKFEKLKWGMEKKIKEITASPAILKKLDEMKPDIKFDAIQDRQNS